VFGSTLPIETFAGNNVEYKGWIKTKEVKNGFAGLWFRVDGENEEVLGFDNMYDRGLKDDNDWTQVSIKMDVNKDAIGIVLGGLFVGSGFVWFDDLELYVNGEKYIDIFESEAPKTLSRKEIATLRKYIYPLRTYEPDGGDIKDLGILDELIGSSSVVALGEVSHGSSEIFKMKNRIIQYLATNNGFNIFSIEENMPESYKLNDYIIRGEGDPKKLITSLYLWPWKTEEVLNLVEWMHKFNQSEKRIEFTGFDMQFFEGAIIELFTAFEGKEDVKKKLVDLKKRLNRIKFSQDNHLRNINDSEMQELDAIITFLRNSIDASPFQDIEKKWLQQNILIIQQYLRETDHSWRDKCMADNFMWIKEHNPNSKLIIWAHNRHIMKTGRKQGFYLAQKLGDDYTTFGFTFYDGSFTATGSKGRTSYKAYKADPGTLEHLLNQLDEPIFILDLKKIKQDNNKDTKWLTKQVVYRSVGSGGGEGYSGEFDKRKITDDLDYLIFIKTSTPSLLLKKN
jgi:erythromycin esterase